LVDSHGPALIYSHLVCASKFAMTLQQHKQKARTSVYKLSDNALSKINLVLQSRARDAALESSDKEGLDTDHEDPNSESDSEGDLDH
jgi:hypothetical protein